MHINSYYNNKYMKSYVIFIIKQHTDHEYIVGIKYSRYSSSINLNKIAFHVIYSIL